MEVFVIPAVKALVFLGSVEQGCKPKTRGTYKRLLLNFDYFWTYLYYKGVTPTNNLAERDILIAVQITTLQAI
jgi:hypothetical protein